MQPIRLPRLALYCFCNRVSHYGTNLTVFPHPLPPTVLLIQGAELGRAMNPTFFPFHQDLVFLFDLAIHSHLARWLLLSKHNLSTIYGDMLHFFSILKSSIPIPHLALQCTALIPQFRHSLLSKRVHPLTNLLTQCERWCCPPLPSHPLHPFPIAGLSASSEQTDSSLPSRPALSSCLYFSLWVFFPFSPLPSYNV